MFRIGQEEIDAVARVINSGDLFKIHGGEVHEVERFQERFQEKFDVKHAILMTSGYGALESALVGMGIGPGDEVIVPAYTYIATAMAVVGVGAVPVIAEVNETLTLDPEDFERKITPNTKAVIPVHIMGLPCEMDKIMEIANKNNILVLEDACQADGGSFKGKRLGTIGKTGAYSFNYFKIITAGEGGALVTDDKDVFERALIYHDSSAIAFFGNQLKEADADVFCGTEYRVSEITGAIMNVQLDRLDGILSDLRRVKKMIMDAVSDVCAFRPSNDIEGDCGTAIPFAFESEEKARKFSEKVGGVLPIDTGKHVYTWWAPILEKKGSFNSKFNIFELEANKKLNVNYSLDMCPKTLDILAKTVYFNIDPNADDERIAAQIKTIREAAELAK